MRIAPLRGTHQGDVRSLLEATRSFSSDEVDVALELFDLCHPGRGEGSAPSGQSEGVELAVAAPDYECIGAFDDSTLIGYACFGPTPSTSGTFDLYWLAVRPAAQGRGAGRALLQWVEAGLQERGARLLVVETSSRTEYSQAREFYARGGYTEAARVRDFYAPADDRVILTTRLTARERGVATR